MADETASTGALIYRQRLVTRVTHWSWAISLFFLMLSGLQIFNAHPALYLGKQSGFEFDNAILRIGAVETEAGLRGVTTLGGHEFDTTGTLGVSGDSEVRAFPAWATIPSSRSLASGRVVHFFFAWILVITLTVWAVASIWNRHAKELIPTMDDLRALPRDIADHARLRFHHTARYNVLQKLAYAGVLFVLLPLMILTGLSMSPNFNAFAPWLLDVFGGRQSARTIHFITMVLLVGFFIIHMLMILAAGPINELRSIVTGWYRIDPKKEIQDEA
jgi:thiosulfate reductase cytochrome b subunit